MKNLIVVLLGGVSGERKISFLTGKACSKALKKRGYKVKELDAKGNFVKKLKKLKPKIVFNALHGKYGEDGFVQSILECLKIPYTHSGILSSSLAMDKELSKILFKKNKIKTPKYFLIHKNNKKSFKTKMKEKKIKFPIVIKPTNEGSSLGVYICKNKKEFNKNYKKLEKNYEKIIVEQYIPGREIQAEMVKALLQDCSELEVKYQGIVDEHAEFVVTVKNINNGHNLPSGSTADRQVWVHLKLVDEQGNQIYESGMLDANGDLMDGVQGHSLNPAGDPELLAFGQFIFNAEGEHVLFPWEAHKYTDHLLGPGQTAWRDYLIPLEEVTGKIISATATLNYRTFPPFLIRQLEDEGFLEPGTLMEIPIVEMETVSGTWTIQ